MGKKKYFEKKNTVEGRTGPRVKKLISQRRQAARDTKWDRGPRMITTPPRNKDWKHVSDQSEES